METVFTAVVEDSMWTSFRRVWFSGVRLRARTTVIRLEDGGLLVHSPAPPTDAMVEQLRALGPVRWLVVPNCFHHLGTMAAAARFPDAKIAAPASAADHNKSLRIDIDTAHLGDHVPELDLLPLLGVPFLDETLLYHRPTQTLLGADIVLRACAADHWTWRFAGRITGCYDRLRVPPDVRKKIVDKPAAARSLHAMVQRPARRLIVAHADVIDETCTEQLARAWRVEGVEL